MAARDGTGTHLAIVPTHPSKPIVTAQTEATRIPWPWPVTAHVGLPGDPGHTGLSSVSAAQPAAPLAQLRTWGLSLTNDLC